MMGHSHAVSGVAAGMALFGTATLSIPPADSGGRTTTIPLGAGLGHLPLSAVVVASLVMGVTALLPDIDSPSSSVSTALPGITGPVSRVIARGGHRTWTPWRPSSLTTSPSGPSPSTASTSAPATVSFWDCSWPSPPGLSASPAAARGRCGPCSSSASSSAPGRSAAAPYGSCRLSSPPVCGCIGWETT